MPPDVVSKHLHEQVRAAVDHLWVVRELGYRIDHAEELYDASYPTKIAQVMFENREQIDRCDARVLVRVLDRDTPADFPSVQRAICLAGTLAGDEQQIADLDYMQKICDG